MTILAGGYDEINALMFGMQDNNAANYFRENIQQLASVPVNNISSTMSFIGNLGAQIQENFNMRGLRAAINQVAGLFRPNVVSYINKISDMQVAGTVMQEWIMAEPSIRKRWQEGRTDGYSETYSRDRKDANDIGENHLHYLAATNGILREMEFDGEKTWGWTEDLGTLEEHGIEIPSFDEQVDILNTWESAKIFMDMEDRDPLSPWNNAL